MLTFYNKNGKATAYLDDDNESIFLYNGLPVAWLSDDTVYSYSGKVLGWFQDGWIRDLNGNCVFFSDSASGGPAKPAKQAKPARGAKSARPAKGARHARPAKAAKSDSWSSLSNESFFK